MALLLRLIGFIPVALVPAYAVLVMERDDADLRLNIAAALSVGAALALAAAWALGRRFVHEPLQRLIDFAHALRDGAYPPRASFAAAASEFDELSRALDEMAERLAAREAALRESEQRFRRLSDASFEGIAIHDGVRLVEANAAAARIFGYEAGEVIGMPVEAFLAPAARAHALAVAHGHEETPYESIGLRKDGTPFPVEFRGRRIEHEGEPRRIIAIRDLTEQTDAAAALHESEERLRLALTAGRLGIWDFDIERLRVRVDERLATMLALPPGKLESTVEECVSRLHPEDRERTTEAFARQIDDPAPSGFEYRVILANGSERWQASHALVLRRSDGTPFRAVGVAQDITERKQTESRLRLLAAEVDHRSKNMLAMVQLMLRHTRADTVNEYVAAAQGRIAALARAHTLLSESRWQAADLRRLADEELAPFRRTDGWRVRLEGPPVALSSRAAQAFAMALHELATNAAKHGALSTPHGRVFFEWSKQEDGRLVVRWSETGGPPVQPPTHRGLGINVIERTIDEQLEGEVRFHWLPAGLVCELVVPASQLLRPDRS